MATINAVQLTAMANKAANNNWKFSVQAVDENTVKLTWDYGRGSCDTQTRNVSNLTKLAAFCTNNSIAYYPVITTADVWASIR